MARSPLVTLNSKLSLYLEDFDGVTNSLNLITRIKAILCEGPGLCDVRMHKKRRCRKILLTSMQHVGAASPCLLFNIHSTPEQIISFTPHTKPTVILSSWPMRPGY